MYIKLCISSTQNLSPSVLERFIGNSLLNRVQDNQIWKIINVAYSPPIPNPDLSNIVAEVEVVATEEEKRRRERARAYVFFQNANMVHPWFLLVVNNLAVVDCHNVWLC